MAFHNGLPSPETSHQPDSCCPGKLPTSKIPGPTQILLGGKALRGSALNTQIQEDEASDALNGPQKLSVRPRRLSRHHKEETDSTFVSCCEIFLQGCSPVKYQDTDKMIGCRKVFKVSVVL